MNLTNLGLNDLLIISQTTFSLEKFEMIVNKVKTNLENESKDINLVIKNTICTATKQRQEETSMLSKKVDLMITIGGKHSSNTLKLFEIASKNCKESILIETYEEINKEYVKKFDKIGIMAGASTPKQSIDLVVELLSNL